MMALHNHGKLAITAEFKTLGHPTKKTMLWGTNIIAFCEQLYHYLLLIKVESGKSQAISTI
jgi:hypothetical protein